MTLTISGDIQTVEQSTNKTVGRLNGIASENKQSLTVNGNIAIDLVSNSERVTGIRANSGDVSVNGDFLTTIKSESGLSYGLDVWTNNKVTLSGGKNTISAFSSENNAYGVSANASGQVQIEDGITEITAASSSSLALGIGVYDKSQIQFTHTSPTINVSSETGRIVGIATESGSTLFLEDAVVNANAYGCYDQSQTRWIQALYSANGTTHASGSLTLNVTTFDNDGNLIDAGDGTAIRVVNLEGSAYSTNALVNGDLTINVHSMAGNVYGVYVSGDRQSSESLHAGVSVNGTLSVNVFGNNAYVNGVYAQGESGVEASKISLEIKSEGKEVTQVAGLVSLTNPNSYPGPGKIIATNGYEASIEGAGTIYGVVSLGTYDNRASIVRIGGKSSITLNSTDDDATAFLIDGGALGSASNLVATVTAKKTATGVSLEGSRLSLSGVNNFSIQGEESSVGFNIVSKSSMNISGQTYVKAQNALVQDETSAIIVGTKSGSETSEQAGLTLEGAVDNNGKFILHRATLAIIGDKDGTYKLGSIVAESESLVDISAGSYEITSFAGDENKTLRLNDLAAFVNFSSAIGAVNLAASSMANDTAVDSEAAAQALLKAVSFGNGAQNVNKTLVIEEGLVNDSLTATIDSNGNLVNVVTTKNTKLSLLSSVASLSLISWRHETNDLFERMGELRNQPQGAGSWVRLYGSEQNYSAKGIEQRNTSIQVGSDFEIGSSWMLGGALSYTDSSSTYDTGSADGETYSLAAYGTWLSDNGHFFDVIARYGRISNDFKVDELSGDYDNNAFSVSAEYGRRFELSTLAFLEPQIELTYSRVLGGDFSAGKNVTVSQDDFDSLVGRIGVRAGLFLPDKKGSIQAKFSVLNDFCGKFDASATNGVARNTMHEDIGGVWVEYGIGGNYNFNGSTQGYLNLERTSSADVDANWRWSFGLRHVW